MKLPKYLKKLSSLRRPFIIRRVVGLSMVPRLIPGKIIIVATWQRNAKPGDVIVALHNKKEIIKRIERHESGKIFVVGDNLPYSTDSRHYGWLPEDAVVGTLLWPRVHNT